MGETEFAVIRQALAPTLRQQTRATLAGHALQAIAPRLPDDMGAPEVARRAVLLADAVMAHLDDAA